MPACAIQSVFCASETTGRYFITKPRFLSIVCPGTLQFLLGIVVNVIAWDPINAIRLPIPKP